LHEAPAYETISYIWGNDPVIHAVQVNGLTFYLKSNLYYALRDIRSSDHGLLLLVDAMCIDQAHEVEKYTQISIMGNIYRQAARTIVWLGERDSKTHLAFEFVKETLQPEFSQGEIWLLKHKITALRSLLDNTSFTRRWVIQEIALSKESI
ncbi:hypothetical protein EK21DRAFT_33221, partial [Setomelanomma holmii]